MTRKLSEVAAAKRDQWNTEARIGFAKAGKAGEKLVRQLWANGEVMVGPEGALANRFIPLADAIAIWKAGWKVYV